MTEQNKSEDGSDGTQGYALATAIAALTGQAVWAVLVAPQGRPER